MDFDISCKMSPKETVCMKSQSLFLGKIRKIMSISVSSTEFAERMVQVNWQIKTYH